MSNEFCPICLDELKRNVVTLACGHKIHGECLRLMGKHETIIRFCPMCRKSLLIRRRYCFCLYRNEKYQDTGCDIKFCAGMD